MAGGACVAWGACVAGGHWWQEGSNGEGGHVWQEHVYMTGGMHGRGHAWQGGMHGRGCAWQGGHVWQGSICGRRHGHCTGRYASYWNAFLLHVITLLFRAKS